MHDSRWNLEGEGRGGTGGTGEVLVVCVFVSVFKLVNVPEGSDETFYLVFRNEATCAYTNVPLPSVGNAKNVTVSVKTLGTGAP